MADGISICPDRSGYISLCFNKMNYLRNGVYSWRWSRSSGQVGEGDGGLVIASYHPHKYADFSQQCCVLPDGVFQPTWIKSSWLTRSKINSETMNHLDKQNVPVRSANRTIAIERVVPKLYVGIDFWKLGSLREAVSMTWR